MLRAGQDVLHQILVNLAVELLHDGPDPEPEAREDRDPVDDGEGGDHGQEDEPEPKEYEDLLVDNVEGEDAEAVVLCDGARGPVHMEGAFGHLREHDVHRVGPDLGVHSGHLDHLSPVSCELIAEEPVRDVDLGDHVNEGHQLAEKEVDGVTPV